MMFVTETIMEVNKKIQICGTDDKFIILLSHLKHKLHSMLAKKNLFALTSV